MNTVPFAYEGKSDFFTDGSGTVLGDVNRVLKICDAPVTSKERKSAEDYPRYETSMERSHSLLKLYCHRLAVRRGRLEELPLGEAKHSSENIRWEGLNLRIQVANHGIVVAARILDRVFSLSQRILQLSKVRRSFQLWIIFCHGKQALQRSGKLVFGSRFIDRASRLHRH